MDRTRLSPSAIQALPRWTCIGRTDTGLVRRVNEDNYLIDPELGMIAVADGMGGHLAGEQASAAALVAMREHLRRAGLANCADDGDITIRVVTSSGNTTRAPAFSGRPSLPTTERAVLQAVQLTNHSLFRWNQRHHHRPGEGMGTTLTGILQYGTQALIAFHIGDSRLYRYRGSRLQCLTTDQTLYQQAIDSGQRSNLPAANALWQAVGPHAEVRPEISCHDWRAGDLFLLCSDGLHGVVPQNEIERTLAMTTQSSLEQACLELVRLAHRHGGRDNITAVLIHCDA